MIPPWFAKYSVLSLMLPVPVIKLSNMKQNYPFGQTDKANTVWWWERLNTRGSSQFIERRRLFVWRTYTGITLSKLIWPQLIRDTITEFSTIHQCTLPTNTSIPPPSPGIRFRAVYGRPLPSPHTKSAFRPVFVIIVIQWVRVFALLWCTQTFLSNYLIIVL